MLHDASEAFIGDVTRPLKAMLPDYRAIERQIENAICDRFLVDDLGNASRSIIRHPTIKAADTAMCAAEARALMPWAPDYWSSLKPDRDIFIMARGNYLPCHGPDAAADTWLKAWHEAGHYEDEKALEGDAL